MLIALTQSPDITVRTIAVIVLLLLLLMGLLAALMLGRWMRRAAKPGKPRQHSTDYRDPWIESARRFKNIDGDDADNDAERD